MTKIEADIAKRMKRAPKVCAKEDADTLEPNEDKKEPMEK